MVRAAAFNGSQQVMFKRANRFVNLVMGYRFASRPSN
jgi:hypothetical protein